MKSRQNHGFLIALAVGIISLAIPITFPQINPLIGITIIFAAIGLITVAMALKFASKSNASATFLLTAIILASEAYAWRQVMLRPAILAPLIGNVTFEPVSSVTLGNTSIQFGPELNDSVSVRVTLLLVNGSGDPVNLVETCAMVFYFDETLPFEREVEQARERCPISTVRGNYNLPARYNSPIFASAEMPRELHRKWTEGAGKIAVVTNIVYSEVFNGNRIRFSYSDCMVLEQNVPAIHCLAQEYRVLD